MGGACGKDFVRMTSASTYEKIDADNARGILLNRGATSCHRELCHILHQR